MTSQDVLLGVAARRAILSRMESLDAKASPFWEVRAKREAEKGKARIQSQYAKQSSQDKEGKTMKVNAAALADRGGWSTRGGTFLFEMRLGELANALLVWEAWYQGLETPTIAEIVGISEDKVIALLPKR